MSSFSLVKARDVSDVLGTAETIFMIFINKAHKTMNTG
jgi:hypothetical protein